ncbi:hypothetical protein HKD37_18G050963 [Glycine soja]
MHEVSDLLDYSEPSSRVFLFDNILLLVVPTVAICSSKGMIPLETIKGDITTLRIITKTLLAPSHIKGLDVTSLKELGRLMGPLQMQAFRKAYGKILDLTIAEIFTEAVVSLTQYYDQPLRCFTFGEFQLLPTVEEFEEILGCPLGGRNPYLFSGFLPSLSKIAIVVRDLLRELDRVKQTRKSVVGLPQKYLEGKARDMANQEEWVPFMDVLALLIFGVVLFPNVDGLVDLAAIDAFLAYHHSKESPVVAILANLFDTFDRRCEKSSARIIYCLPALCVLMVSHLFQQDIRHPCPLRSHRSLGPTLGWDRRQNNQLVSSMEEGKEGVLFSCGEYPNIPLIGMRGCINYNPALAIRQLGYPMRGAPAEESLSPFLVRDFGAQNFKIIQRVHKAWESPLRKDKELRGIRNGIIGGYHEWLKENFEALEEDEEVRALKTELGKARLAKEKFKLVAIDVRKECVMLREENAATARALEQETKWARKEEHGRDKFQELAACSRSKKSLSQRLCETETNMLAIASKYQEELNLAMAHEHKVADEYARVYAEKEARGRVIDSLHQEATMWMDRFALTLNESQELPRLLAKAKAMADTYSAPEEIHGLLSYYPTLPATVHHRLPNAVGRERSTLGHISNPHLGYNRYEQHHPSFSAHAGDSSISAPVQPRALAPIQREAPQAPAPTTTRPASNAHFGTGSNAMRNFPPRPTPEFTPIPMTYEDLLLSLIANQMAVISLGKIYQPPFPKWYNPDATCAYHGKTPGHSTEKCLAFKYKVQHLIDVGWLTFQEDRPNVKTNPLANHGGGAVNVIESGRPRRSKPLKDVTTPRRFIYEALQKGGIISHGGHGEDSYLMHPSELHNMETCLAMIDRGRLEVSDEGSEEQHICMQSADEGSFGRPKPLVVYFTRDIAPQTPRYPSVVKPIPFPYQNNHAAPWRYAPPSERKEEVTDISSLSAKITNITGLRGVTHSGRVFAPPDLPTQPANVKGKAKITEGQDDEMIPTSNENAINPQLGRKIEGGSPCHISRSFISAGLGHKGQVIAICEDDSLNGSHLVRPCPPGFRLGNWRVEERPDIYATSITGRVSLLLHVLLQSSLGLRSHGSEIGPRPRQGRSLQDSPNFWRYGF